MGWGGGGGRYLAAERSITGGGVCNPSYSREMLQYQNVSEASACWRGGGHFLKQKYFYNTKSK